MKGQELPMNMIVVVAIAVVALLALGAFLFSGSLSNFNAAEAQRVFATGCTQYCSSDLYGTLQNAYQASQNNPDFVKACVNLGYIKSTETMYMNRCLDKCGNCNLDVGTTDTAAGFDSLVAKTTRG